MTEISVVTVGRSDFGIYLPVLKAIQKSPRLSLRILASGMHLSRAHGYSIEAIAAAGFDVAESLPMLLASDSPEAVAKSMGLGVMEFAGSFARKRPELLMLLGDRFEMYTAAIAALPFSIPIAHIHGGELTEGAIDDAIRHSITKLSHLHFVTTEDYRKRVIQLGEEPWRVVLSGAPSLDNLASLKLMDFATFQRRVGHSLQNPFVLMTYHPVTKEFNDAKSHITGLLKSLEACGHDVLVTLPNADTANAVIIESLRACANANRRFHLVENLGTELYFNAMNLAAAMVGNSSSGLLEAPSFKLPVVNIGTRQKGRLRAKNVIDVGYDPDEISKALKLATSPQFRTTLAGLKNPYGEGHAASVIVDHLERTPIDQKLVSKAFYDIKP